MVLAIAIGGLQANIATYGCDALALEEGRDLKSPVSTGLGIAADQHPQNAGEPPAAANKLAKMMNTRCEATLHHDS